MAILGNFLSLGHGLTASTRSLESIGYEKAREDFSVDSADPHRSEEIWSLVSPRAKPGLIMQSQMYRVQLKCLSSKRIYE